MGEAAKFTFGLTPDTSGAPAHDRRRMAAEVYDLSSERFRRVQERVVIEQTAEAILKLCHEQRQHDARAKLGHQYVPDFES